MAGVEVKVGILRRADHRRAVRRHRAQAAPERRLGEIAAAREQIGQRVIERGAACVVELARIAGDFGGAADADAIAEARDRDFVALVHHGRFRRAGGVLDRHRDRIALHRIDRQRNAKRRNQPRRPASEREHVGVGLQHARAGRDTTDARAIRDDAIDAGIEHEAHAERFGMLGQRLREHVAVAGLVLRQAKPAGELLLHGGERRLGRDAALPLSTSKGTPYCLSTAISSPVPSSCAW